MANIENTTTGTYDGKLPTPEEVCDVLMNTNGAVIGDIQSADMLQWIADHVEPVEHHINGHVYMKQRMERIDRKPYPDPIKFHTLDGLLDYIRSGCDRQEDMHYFLRVLSPELVVLETELDEEQNRIVLARAEARVPSGIITESGESKNRKTTEEFIIGLRTCFEKHHVCVLETELDDVEKEDKAVQESEENKDVPWFLGKFDLLEERAEADRALLLSIVSNLVDDTSVKRTDDGMAQQVQINAGVGTVADAVMPDIVHLSPYRTFKEIHQPISDFIFRVEKVHDELYCALIGADGGAWKDSVTKELAAYCEDMLEDDEHCDNVIVLR